MMMGVITKRTQMRAMIPFWTWDWLAIYGRNTFGSDI
jgi:hypothetical protein